MTTDILLDFPALSEEDVRAALEAWLATSPRWVPQDLMERIELRSWTTHRACSFALTSLVETREQLTAHRSHAGQAPNLPDPLAEATPLQLPVPETWSDTTHDFPCYSKGQVVECANCSGGGRHVCAACGGDGTVTRTRTVSSGIGENRTTRRESYTVTCSNCDGSGRVRCAVCVGTGELWAFPITRVGRRVLSSQGCYDRTALPDALLKRGEVEETLLAPGGLGPELDGFSPALRQRIVEDVEKQLQRQAGARLLVQRIDLRWLPVTELRYALASPLGKQRPAAPAQVTSAAKQPKPAAAGTSGILWLYGEERSVHAPELQTAPSWFVALVCVAALLLGIAILAGIVAISLAR